MVTRRRAACAAAAALLLAVMSGGCGSHDDGGGGTGNPPTSEPYSVSLAAELCRLCLLSYEALTDFENGQPFTLPAPYTLRQQFSTPERYVGESVGVADSEVPIAYTATAGKAIYVVFRGTKTITEWIDDATVEQVANDYISSGGKIEVGFNTVYATLHEPIVAAVNDLIAQGGYTTLYVTGHSLGAALATLAAPELQARTTLQPILYNFAGPRAGDPVFSLRYDELVPTSWRVANTNDVVPKLPPTSVILYRNGHYQFLFYEHVETEVAITFGHPVSDPLDVQDIENNHAACNYYATLCAQTADPPACRQKAGGADGCTLN